MYARNDSGQLLYSQGSIAIHIFSVNYLARGDLNLPFHVARKKVKTLIPVPSASEIEEREAIKLETFIFDECFRHERKRMDPAHLHESTRLRFELVFPRFRPSRNPSRHCPKVSRSVVANGQAICVTLSE